MMKKYVCTVCGYEYDPEVGEPDAGIAPGTPWETFRTIMFARSAALARTCLKRRKPLCQSNTGKKRTDREDPSAFLVWRVGRL